MKYSIDKYFLQRIAQSDDLPYHFDRGIAVVSFSAGLDDLLESEDSAGDL